MGRNLPPNTGDMGSIPCPGRFHMPLCAVCLVAQSCLTATPWTIVHQVLCPLGFSRQEYWSGLPCPPPGDLPNPGIEPRSPELQADSLLSEPPGNPVKQPNPCATTTKGHVSRAWAPQLLSPCSGTREAGASQLEYSLPTPATTPHPLAATRESQALQQRSSKTKNKIN